MTDASSKLFTRKEAAPTVLVRAVDGGGDVVTLAGQDRAVEAQVRGYLQKA
jgi:hypothetical protein